MALHCRRQPRRKSFDATPARQTFCGHVHSPALYLLSQAGKLFGFMPTAGVAVPLLGSRRFLAVLGAVGQPRDHNPAAAYAMLDETQNMSPTSVCLMTSRGRRGKSAKPGLPPLLAARLEQGY